MKFTSLQKETKKELVKKKLKTFLSYSIPVVTIISTVFFAYQVLIKSDVDFLNSFYVLEEKPITFSDEEVISNFKFNYSFAEKLKVDWENKLYSKLNWLKQPVTWNELLWFNTEELYKLKREVSYKWLYVEDFNSVIWRVLWKNYKVFLTTLAQNPSKDNYETLYKKVNKWEFSNLISIASTDISDWYFIEYSDLYDLKSLKEKIWNKKIFLMWLTSKDVQNIYFKWEYLYFDWFVLFVEDEESMTRIKQRLYSLNKTITTQNDKWKKIILITDKNQEVHSFLWDKRVENAISWYRVKQ